MTVGPSLNLPLDPYPVLHSRAFLSPETYAHFLQLGIFCVAIRGFPFWFWYGFALTADVFRNPVAAPDGTRCISVRRTTNVALTMHACLFLRIIHPMRPHGYVHPHIRNFEFQWVSSYSDHPRGHINRQAPYYPWLLITNPCIDEPPTIRPSHWNR